MAAVSLELFKEHVRATEFADDDAYLLHLLDTAEEVVLRDAHRTAEEMKALGVNGSFPKAFIHAVMVLAAHWYNQRESVAGVQMYEVPSTLQALTKPLRKLV